LAVLIGLTLIVVNTGFKQIMDVRKKLADARVQETSLTSKLDTLQKGQSSFESLSDLSAVAIPEKSPAAVVTSQVKSLGVSAKVVVTDVSVTTQAIAESALQNLEVKVAFEGDLIKALDYLSSLNLFLPLSIIDEIALSRETDSVSAEVQLTAFFAPFPTSLPPITSAIQDLTDEEKKLLGSFASYSQPTFSQVEFVPGEPYERTDLFNF